MYKAIKFNRNFIALFNENIVKYSCYMFGKHFQIDNIFIEI